MSAKTLSSSAPAAPIAPAAPVAIAAAPDSNSTIISMQGLDRTGKMVPILIFILGFIILPIAVWYGAQQGQKAYLDTLIQERGAQNADTRAKLGELTNQFNQAEIRNAQFRGETLASLKAIEKAVDTERGDRRDDRPR